MQHTRICLFSSLAEMVPVISSKRSLSVLLPWSMWATMQKLRKRSRGMAAMRFSRSLSSFLDVLIHRVACSGGAVVVGIDPPLIMVCLGMSPKGDRLRAGLRLDESRREGKRIVDAKMASRPAKQRRAPVVCTRRRHGCRIEASSSEHNWEAGCGDRGLGWSGKRHVVWVVVGRRACRPPKKADPKLRSEGRHVKAAPPTRPRDKFPWRGRAYLSERRAGGR